VSSKTRPSPGKRLSAQRTPLCISVAQSVSATALTTAGSVEIAREAHQREDKRRFSAQAAAQRRRLRGAV
jgi:hypothetical protein